MTFFLPEELQANSLNGKRPLTAERVSVYCDRRIPLSHLMIEFTVFKLHTVVLFGYNTCSNLQRLKIPATMLEVDRFITVLK
jgi:hypothetical protein